MNKFESPNEQILYSQNPYVFRIQNNTNTLSNYKFMGETNYNTSTNYAFVIIDFTSHTNTLKNKNSRLLLIENKKKISGFRNLSENWNGYGAKPFNPKTLDRAEKLLLTLTSQPKVFPTGRDSVQFEFEKDNGDYLEFEIFENQINYLQIQGKEEIDKPLDESDINELIEAFNA